MEGFWISKLMQGSKYATVWLNVFEYDMNMLKYFWTYGNKQGSEYARVSNMSLAKHSVRSVLKLMSTYWEIDVFRTLSKI